MKKYILYILFISTFIMSCGGHFFNPKYYYNSNKIGSSTSSGDDSIDIGGGGEGLSPEEDPFNNENNDKPWNEPNYGGFELDLDNMVIEAYFDKNNRPTYKLKEGQWTPLDSSKNEYYYNGANTSAAGYEMGNVKYYMYKAKNPTFEPNSSYNKSDRLERFYFYKFYGSYMGVGTENYLIAIDKYSKLVFAFAVPTKWKNMLVRYAPEEWGSVELGWEAKYKENSQSIFEVDGIKYFYEYDPVGIVKRDGTIEIYSWCSDSISQNIYAPRVLGNKIDLTRDIAREGVINGRSPYMPMKTEETTKDTVTITAKSLKNISVRSKAGYLDWAKPTYPDSSKLEWGYFTYAIAGSAYDADIPVEAANIEELYPDGVSATESTFLDYNKLKIDIGSYKEFTLSKSYEIKNIKSKEVYIDLSANVYKYNTLKAAFLGTYLDTDNFGEGGSGKIAEKTAPILKLKYDASKDVFVIDSSSITENSSTSATITYPNNFTLERGVSKDITIKYKWIKGNDTNGEEIEVTYTLKFESSKQ